MTDHLSDECEDDVDFFTTECWACEDSEVEDCCPRSQRECGHHCNDAAAHADRRVAA